MTRIAKHIQAAITAGTFTNAAELARIMNKEKSTISRWLAGKTSPSAAEARQLAQLLELPEGVLMAEAEAERAKDSATKAAWLRVARLCSFRSKKGTTLALCVLAFVVLYLTSSQDLAFASMAYVGSNVDNTNYRAFLALVGLALIASTFQQCRRPFRSKEMIRST